MQIGPRSFVLRWRLAGSVALAAAAVTTAAAYGQLPPAFQTGTRVVPLYATVRGQDGRLVPNLPQDTFEVLDNGRPVPITVFSNDRLPITVTVMLDVSGGFVDIRKYEQIRASVSAFVDALEPGDRGRIGTFSQREIAIGAHLTSEKIELKRVLWEEFWPGYGARPLWSAIGTAMTGMAGEPGRRVVLVLTDGPNTTRMAGRPDLRFVETQAASEGFMVYAVTFSDRPFIGSGRRDFASRDDDPQALSRVTARTGGGQFVAPGGTALTAALVQVAEELRHQYTVGFAPETLDGKVHKIEVRMNTPGLSARARTEYLAMSEAAPR